MGDPIDEYLGEQVREFTSSNEQKLKFVSVTKDGLVLPGEETVEDTDDVKALCSAIKEVLGDKVEKVVTGRRIVDALSRIVTAQYGWSANMERIMKAQALRNDTMNFMAPKKIFEINPEHDIIKRLCSKLGGKKTLDTSSKDLVHLLYEVSLILPGLTSKTRATSRNGCTESSASVRGTTKKLTCLPKSNLSLKLSLSLTLSLKLAIWKK